MRRGLGINPAAVTTDDGTSTANSATSPYAYSTDGNGGGSSSSSTPTEPPNSYAGTTTSTTTEELLRNCDSTAIDLIGDGNCDTLNNIVECLYDGDDCCPCTCVDGPTYTCGRSGFVCLSPNAGLCNIDEAATSASSANIGPALVTVIFGAVGVSLLGCGFTGA